MSPDGFNLEAILASGVAPAWWDVLYLTSPDMMLSYLR
jgi:hypothetical protein